MTVRQYAASVVISAGIAITGVMWYQNRMPYIAGEDIAALTADAYTVRSVVISPAIRQGYMRDAWTYGNEDYWYPGAPGTWDWVYKQVGETTITVFRASSDIQNLCALVQDCFIDADAPGALLGGTYQRYYLDPRCLSGAADELTMKITPQWSNTPTYTLYIPAGNYKTNIVFSGTITNIDADGVTLLDRMTTGTNKFGAPSVYLFSAAVNTPISRLGSIYRTPPPVWPDMTRFDGRQNYTAFTNRLNGCASWWTYAGISPISYMLEPLEVLRVTDCNPVNLSYAYIDWRSYELGKSPDKTFTDPGVGVSVRPTAFITTNGLNVIRKVLTNMVRTVEFSPVCVGTNITFTHTATYGVESTNGFSNSDPINYIPLVTNTLTASTNALTTTLTGYQFYSAEERLYNRLYKYPWAPTNYVSSADSSVIWTHYSFSPTNIPISMYTNGFVKRVRFYVTCDSTTPMLWYPRLSVYSDAEVTLTGLTAYTRARLNEYESYTNDYPIVVNNMLADIMPVGVPSDNYRSWVWVTALSNRGKSFDNFATNQIWNLIGDTTNTLTTPVFTFTNGKSQLGDVSFRTPTQMVEATGPEIDLKYLKAYWLYHKMQIMKTMMVVDWNIPLMSNGGTNVYTPAWATTNSVP